jgi:hypothetical protein
VWRTALRELLKRRASPSPDQITTEVNAPMPYSRCSSRQPGWRQRRFLQTSGEILNQGNKIIVRLDRRAYSPVLRQAQLPTITVPWWGNRQLTYQFA